MCRLVQTHQCFTEQFCLHCKGSNDLTQVASLTSWYTDIITVGHKPVGLMCIGQSTRSYQKPEPVGLVCKGQSTKSHQNPDDVDWIGVRNTGVFEPHDATVSPRRLYLTLLPWKLQDTFHNFNHSINDNCKQIISCAHEISTEDYKINQKQKLNHEHQTRSDGFQGL